MDIPEVLSVNDKSYRVIKLLGKGKGGYSFLVTDGEQRYVLKQIHHEPCDYYNFGDKLKSELDDYARLKAVGISIPKLIDTDVAHERIIKEYIDGKTVSECIIDGEMKEDYLSQIKQMCRLLYSAHLNIDYFPTNFIACGGTLYYIDYECNSYSDEWNFENWGIKYWSKTGEFCKHFGVPADR
ncbi:MAG: hypothetical protein K2O04_02115 [Clostridiales bacterium]|nr:hypothetical protein [Clostridiales bacterium]